MRNERCWEKGKEAGHRGLGQRQDPTGSTVEETIANLDGIVDLVSAGFVVDLPKAVTNSVSLVEEFCVMMPKD